MRWLAVIAGLLWAGAAGADYCDVVLFGDSSVASTHHYSDYLSTQCTFEVQGGASTTTGDLVDDSDEGANKGTSPQDYVDAGNSLQGKIGLISSGPNDGRTPHQDGITSTADTVANLIEAAEEIETLGGIPIIVVPPPCDYDVGSCDTQRADWIDAIAPLIPVAAAAADIDYVDAWTPFETTAQDIADLLVDSLHLNAAGKMKIGLLISEKIDALRPPPVYSCAW